MNIRLLPEMTVKGITLAALRVAVLVYILNGVLLYVRQDTLLYFPDRTPFALCPRLKDAERVDIGGTRGYFFQNGTSTKLAVFYHGNAGRACDRAYYRSVFEHAGYSWLLVEYGGFAEENIEPSTALLLRDATHVAQWANTRAVTRIAVVGESIGAGAAAHHAAQAPVDLLVLITPFDRLSAVAGYYYPYYPVRLLLSDDLLVARWAARAQQVLVVHGTADTIIPYSFGEALFAALPQTQKELLTLDGIDHNETPALGITQSAIMHFLREEK